MCSFTLKVSNLHHHSFQTQCLINPREKLQPLLSVSTHIAIHAIIVEAAAKWVSSWGHLGVCSCVPEMVQHLSLSRQSFHSFFVIHTNTTGPILNCHSPTPVQTVFQFKTKMHLYGRSLNAEKQKHCFLHLYTHSPSTEFKCVLLEPAVVVFLVCILLDYL